MDSFVAEFDGAATDGDRAKILNWTINHLVTNIQPNLRIDLLADSQSELAKRFCRISKRRRADQVDCDARPLDESTCSTSKGCAFRST